MADLLWTEIAGLHRQPHRQAVDGIQSPTTYVTALTSEMAEPPNLNIPMGAAETFGEIKARPRFRWALLMHQSAA